MGTPTDDEMAAEAELPVEVLCLRHRLDLPPPWLPPSGDWGNYLKPLGQPEKDMDHSKQVHPESSQWFPCWHKVPTFPSVEYCGLSPGVTTKAGRKLISYQMRNLKERPTRDTHVPVHVVKQTVESRARVIAANEVARTPNIRWNKAVERCGSIRDNNSLHPQNVETTESRIQRAWACVRHAAPKDCMYAKRNITITAVDALPYSSSCGPRLDCGTSVIMWALKSNTFMVNNLVHLELDVFDGPT
ncbi:hypothetical protein BKA70DRAFT_1464751 [Coprinopsis sp. MPI-PUGE-AT-0042]|nr:hypothetical protein BKA70DRAFT_1464751 [Coprinopsis sp. MPI-PUGE-AT-0042]